MRFGWKSSRTGRKWICSIISDQKRGKKKKKKKKEGNQETGQRAGKGQRKQEKGETKKTGGEKAGGRKGGKRGGQQEETEGGGGGEVELGKKKENVKPSSSDISGDPVLHTIAVTPKRGKENALIAEEEEGNARVRDSGSDIRIRIGSKFSNFIPSTLLPLPSVEMSARGERGNRGRIVKRRARALTLKSKKMEKEKEKEKEKWDMKEKKKSR